MFYQEALPAFLLLSRVDGLLTIRDGHWRKLATMFKKPESAKLTSVCAVTGAFSCGVPIFVWVLTNTMWLLQSKWVPIFMMCWFCVGAYYPNFTVHMHMHTYQHTPARLLSHNMAECSSCTCSFERLYNAYNYFYSHKLYCLLKLHREYLPFVQTV